MVDLTEKLLEILDLRKQDFTGADIKSVVESIAISETIKAINESDKKDPEAILKNEALMKEWMFGGDK